MKLTPREERLIETIRKADICPANAILFIEIGLKNMGNGSLAKVIPADNERKLEALKWYNNISKRKCKQCGKEFENEDSIEDMSYCSDECYLAASEIESS